MPTYVTINGSNKLMTKLYSYIDNSYKYCPLRYAQINGSFYIVHKDKTEISTLYTTSTTWKAPTGVTQILLEIVGGGGSGASYTQHSTFVAGGSGGGGGYFKGYVNVTPGTTYTLTIGSGGTRVAISGESGVDGNDGTASKFGNFVTCNGGKKGLSYYHGYTGGSGGTVSLGNNIAKTLYNITGTDGGNGYKVTNDSAIIGYGGSSGWRSYTSSAKPYYGRGGNGGRTSYNNSSTNTFSTGEPNNHGWSESGQQGAIKITYYKYGGKYV